MVGVIFIICDVGIWCDWGNVVVGVFVSICKVLLVRKLVCINVCLV